MPATWICPRCHRVFRQLRQAHSCGAGSREALLAKKPEALVQLYEGLERLVQSLDGTEIVAKDRYALFRTTRVFADVVFMKDALRLAVLLDHRVEDPLFFKVQALNARRVGHVAKLRTHSELRAVTKYLRLAHRFALDDAPD